MVTSDPVAESPIELPEPKPLDQYLLDLADRLTRSDDPREREEIKKELARMTFGA